MQLSTNEQVVRQWDYATSKSGMIDLNKTQATLTVTNKRVIHDVRNKLEISRTEVQLKDVKTVHLTQTRKSMVGPIAMIVVGILLALIGIIVGMMDEAMMFVLAIGLILGIILIIAGILKMRGGAFTMDLYTYGVSENSLSIGAMGGKGLGKKNTSKIQVTVNNDVAFDIVESITAIILDAKEGALSPVSNTETY